MKAVILAAGLGTRIRSVSGGMPKCMVEVGGRSLIERQIERIAQAGIDGLVVVTGHQEERVRDHVKNIAHPLARRAEFVFNDHYSDMGNFYSLLVAQPMVRGVPFVRMDGDVLMDPQVLPILMKAKGQAVLAVDRRDGMGAEEMKIRLEGDKVVELNKRMDPRAALGEFIGIDRIEPEAAPVIFDALQSLIDHGETDEYYERAYERLAQAGTLDFAVADITGCTWTEVDDGADLAAAEKMASALA